MQKIGIYEDVINASILNKDGFYFRTPFSKGNEVLAQLKMGKIPKGELRFDFAAANLGQDDLAKLILEHASKLPNFEIMWGHRYVGCKQTEKEGKVTVCAVTNKGEKFLSAEYVVGCDGATSQVRRSLCIPFEGFTWDVCPASQRLSPAHTLTVSIGSSICGNKRQIRFWKLWIRNSQYGCGPRRLGRNRSDHKRRLESSLWGTGEFIRTGNSRQIATKVREIISGPKTVEIRSGECKSLLGTSAHRNTLPRRTCDSLWRFSSRIFPLLLLNKLIL